MPKRRTERVRAFYSVFARGYDQFRTLWGRWTARAERELDALFERHVGPATQILELAPGTGVNLDRLKRCAPDFKAYVGLDASPEMLARARRRARGDARVELLLADVTDLSNHTEPFDFIVSTWLLSHLERPEEVVLAALERLAPGGTAVFVFCTRPHNPLLRAVVAAFLRIGHARFVDRDALRKLPGLTRMESSAGGLSTLAVFQGPSL